MSRSGKPAASVLLFDDVGRVLAITKGHDSADLNVPGGGSEPLDTSPAHTAARELREETGVVVDPRLLEPLVERSDGRHVLFYAPRGAVVVLPAQLRSEPFEGWVGWFPPHAVLAPTSRYRETAWEAYQRLGLVP